MGIRQFRFRRRQRRSPYRGWGLWHHYAGLLFGLFTLTWLLSGLFSVNPWGALEGRSFANEAERLGGLPVDFASVREAVRSLDGTVAPTGAVRLEGFAAGGELSFMATNGEGQRRRLDHETFGDAPLRESYFENATATLRPDADVRDAGWIDTGDAYYYSHHETRSFPVYRIRYEDGERVDLDRVSGELVFAVDRERRWLRWVFHALHRGDLHPVVRARPVWDLMMWLLLLGVTVGTVTGTWMGVRRIVRWCAKPRQHPFNATPAIDAQRSVAR